MVEHPLDVRKVSGSRPLVSTSFKSPESEWFRAFLRCQEKEQKLCHQRCAGIVHGNSADFVALRLKSMYNINNL